MSSCDGTCIVVLKLSTYYPFPCPTCPTLHCKIQTGRPGEKVDAVENVFCRRQ